jgi:hypothetical protein
MGKNQDRHQEKTVKIYRLEQKVKEVTEEIRRKSNFQ